MGDPRCQKPSIGQQEAFEDQHVAIIHFQIARQARLLGHQVDHERLGPIFNGVQRADDSRQLRQNRLAWFLPDVLDAGKARFFVLARFLRLAVPENDRVQRNAEHLGQRKELLRHQHVAAIDEELRRLRDRIEEGKLPIATAVGTTGVLQGHREHVASYKQTRLRPLEQRRSSGSDVVIDRQRRGRCRQATTRQKHPYRDPSAHVRFSLVSNDTAPSTPSAASNRPHWPLCFRCRRVNKYRPSTTKHSSCTSISMQLLSSTPSGVVTVA